MKKLILISFLFATLTSCVMAQYTTPRFSTSASGDNTGRVLTYGYVTPTYASTYKVIPKFYNNTVKIALTGALTVTSDTTFSHVCDILNFIFSADGTDRIVSFSTGFSSENDTIQSSTSQLITFTFNGHLWVRLSGQGIVNGLFGNGSVGAPSISFASDTDNGLYRIGANNIGVAAGGTKILDIASTGLSVTGKVTTTTGNVRKNTSTAYTATGAISAAQLAGGLITITSGTDTLTLPTATLLASALGATAGTIFEFVLQNTASGGTALLAVNTGIVAASAVTGGTTLSLANSATVGMATFRITFISTTAATVSRIN